MKLDIIGARLVRGSMKGDDGRDIHFDKVKIYSLADSPNPNHLGKEVGIFEGPGNLWETQFQSLTFPGTYELDLGQTLRGGKFVPVINGIKSLNVK